MSAILLPKPVARHPGSQADLGPYLDVVTWILLVISGLAVFTRLVTKRALRRRFDIDDGFVVAALVSYSPLFAETLLLSSRLVANFAAIDYERRLRNSGEYPDRERTRKRYCIIG
jgi:hypothetical protein